MVNVLIAYPYFKSSIIKSLHEDRSYIKSLMVDSGAFTAFNGGYEIPVYEYVNFLNKIKSLSPQYIIQLDVIGDHERTFENYFEMVQRGITPVPVFTRGAPLNDLDYIYEKISDFVLLGGVASGAGRHEYVNMFLKRNKGRKVHLLGYTNTAILKKHKVYSLDASSWKKSARFGGLDVFINGKGIFSFDLKKIYKDRVKIRGYLVKKNETLGEWFDGYLRNHRQKGAIIWGKSFHQMISTYSWIEYAYWAKAKFNSNFYFSCSATWDLELIKKCIEIFKYKTKEVKL